MDPLPEPLWIVRQTLKRPVCVCVVSMLGALVPTMIILGGLATGYYKFELDMSPASMKTQGDPVADRIDAYFAFFEDYTTDKSPGLNRIGGDTNTPSTCIGSEACDTLVAGAPCSDACKKHMCAADGPS